MAGTQKNVRLSRRGLELLHALKYALDLSDNLVVEAALSEAAENLLQGCGQRLALAWGLGALRAAECGEGHSQPCRHDRSGTLELLNG